jgi:hypothetical protein
MEAYTLYNDPRVSAIGIFNSGFTDAKNTTPSKITKPIFYFLGGSADIAFANVCFLLSLSPPLPFIAGEVLLYLTTVIPKA